MQRKKNKEEEARAAAAGVCVSLCFSVFVCVSLSESVCLSTVCLSVFIMRVNLWTSHKHMRMRVCHSGRGAAEGGGEEEDGRGGEEEDRGGRKEEDSCVSTDGGSER